MEGLYAFPPALRTLAEEQMLPGERVMWAGRPSPMRVFMMTSAIWLFGVPWTAASSVFFGSAVASALGLAKIDGMEGAAGSGLFLLFSLPFMGIGLAMLAAPFWTAAEAGRSGYVVTDRRVLSLTSAGGMAPGRAVKGLAAGALRGAQCHLFSNGRGTVKALGPVGRDSDGDRQTDEIVMTGVEDPRGAERAIWKLVESAGGA